jgi:hypothetical protein
MQPRAAVALGLSYGFQPTPNRHDVCHLCFDNTDANTYADGTDLLRARKGVGRHYTAFWHMERIHKAVKRWKQ